MGLTLDGIRITRSGRHLLDDVSVAWKAGEVAAICGPNGAGKSTALSVMAGSLRPDAGAAQLDGTGLNRFNVQALARRRAVLTQSPVLQFPFRVHEVIELGRTPHYRGANKLSDQDIVERAMAKVQIQDLAYRNYLSLSGGERQRVHLARALAQIWVDDDSRGDDAAMAERWLLLDEPTSALDLKHQLVLMRLLREYAAQGYGVVAVLHDLRLVARWADRCVLFGDGKIVADGPVASVLTNKNVANTYGLAASDLGDAVGNLVFGSSPSASTPGH